MPVVNGKSMHLIISLNSSLVVTLLGNNEIASYRSEYAVRFCSSRFIIVSIFAGVHCHGFYRINEKCGHKFKFFSFVNT